MTKTIIFLLTFAAVLWHPVAVHINGAAPALKASKKGAERGFLIGDLSELPGYREALGVPLDVNTAQAFLLPEVQNNGGATMQKCQRVTISNQNYEVSDQIEEAQTLINKIKKDYRIAATIASSTAFTIEKMAGEINELSEKLEQLTAIRQGRTLKVLSFHGKEIKS